jgi:hypothetical protein
MTPADDRSGRPSRLSVNTDTTGVARSRRTTSGRSRVAKPFTTKEFHQ